MIMHEKVNAQNKRLITLIRTFNQEAKSGLYIAQGIPSMEISAALNYMLKYCSYVFEKPDAPAPRDVQHKIQHIYEQYRLIKPL